MIFLGVEATSNSSSYVIIKDQKIIFQDYMDLKITHSETIMVRIQQALDLVKISPNHLNAVFVSIGPGSFMGVRVSLATAKGICLALKIPLVAFNTLDILAANVYGSNNDILCVKDAFLQEAYIQVYNPNLEVVHPVSCVPYQSIKAMFPNNYLCSGDTFLLPNDQRFKKSLQHQNLVTGAGMYSLFLLKKIPLQFDEISIINLEPLYIRKKNMLFIND